MGDKDYWWCMTDTLDATKWDYCSPHNKVNIAFQVMRVHYSSNVKECGGEYAQQGVDVRKDQQYHFGSTQVTNFPLPDSILTRCA